MSNEARDRFVSFLFTDIEGSTRAWEAHPRAMGRALQQHDSLLRPIFEAHHGRVFKTVGDAFYCAFSETLSAVTAAIEAQQALHAARWPPAIGELRVRMAVHAGPAVHHDGDYFGPTVNRVARLLAIGHGGQILLSASAAAALATVKLDGITLRDLGSHRLKDLKQAESTYQVVAAGLDAEFPALASLDAHPNNLPSQLSTFVGRQRELSALQESLAASRVVTIAGPGGVGKTRLALQLAAELVAEFDGVYFVSLAAVSNGSLVFDALASALEVAESPIEPLDATVLRYLGAKRTLLVFDNAEHLLAPAASAIKQIVSSCPNVRFLVTSREPLHLTGEAVQRLAPLAVSGEAHTLAELEMREATRLFLERARGVAAELTLSPEQCARVAEICRRLEGIPLAIELAASRLATMPLERLAAKLDVSILTNKDPTADRRHRTLRDAIEWSYAMLDPAEQRVFCAFAVFAGGCTIEALERVVLDGNVEEHLDSLVDKSLTQLYEREDREARYRLLEPIAEFALLQLDAAGLTQMLRLRHFNLFRNLARDSVRAPPSRRPPLYARLDAEVANVRAALAWAAASDVQSAAQFASELGLFWRSRGSFGEARGWFARFLDRSSPITPWLRANLLRQSAGLAAMQDDYQQSIDSVTSALAIFREIEDGTGIGLSLLTLGEVAHRQGRLKEAVSFYQEAFPHLEAAGHVAGKTACLINRGMIARQASDFQSAEEFLEQASANVSDDELRVQIQIEHAWAVLSGGNAERAEAAFRAAFAESVAEKNLHGICYARLGVATVALLASRMEVALEEYATALNEARTLSAQILAADAIYGIAAMRALSGSLVAAAKCCSLAARLAEEAKCGERWGIAYTIATQRVRDELTEEQRDAAARTVAAVRPEEAPALTD